MPCRHLWFFVQTMSFCFNSLTCISSDYFQPPTPSPSSRRGVVPRTSSSPGSSGGAASVTPHVVIGQVANLGHVTLSGGRAGSTTTHVVEASFQPRDPVQLKFDYSLFLGVANHLSHCYSSWPKKPRVNLFSTELLRKELIH